MAFALRSRFIALLSIVLVSSIAGGSVPVMAEEESNPFRNGSYCTDRKPV